jgi:hypothetical protein
MKTWEEAKVMELNINETAADADENAGIETTCLNWGPVFPGNGGNNNKPPFGGNNNGGSDSSTGSGSDSSDSFVDSLS